MAKKFTPKYEFDQFFGKNPEDYFTAARIANAERTYEHCIIENQSEAIESMIAMTADMINQINQAIVGNIEDSLFDTIYAQAFSVKCNAGMYGFPLATAFANQLFYYCKDIAGKPITANAKTSISAHLSALKLIFKNNIRNITDPTAQELLKELEKIGKIR